MKTLSILGSTGSIGTQTLDIVRKSAGEFKVCAISGGSNVRLLEEQAREFKPEIVCVGKEELKNDLETSLKDTGIKVVSGKEGLTEVAAHKDADVTVTAIVGMMGIMPTIEAINAGKDIALANKETLVTAGHIIMPLAKEKGVSILPVYSEHSAVFQCIQGEKQDQIHKLIITASGGPFRGFTKEALKSVSLEDALKHPNWFMGKKITIDSATMVNKGLEVIEARWLYDITVDNIQVVVHPQSIVHSMVEFDDGAIKAQLGVPDMRHPIQYALYYPDRYDLELERLDFYKVSSLDFEEPDMEVFEGLKMAYDSSKKGGNMPVIFNAANEFAVAKFLSGEIRFVEIYELIKKAMADVAFIDDPDIEQVLATEKAVYEMLGTKS